MILSMDITTLEANIKSLDTWCKDAKIAQEKVKDESRGLQGITSGIQNTNLGAGQDKSNLSEIPRRPFFVEKGIKNQSRLSRSRSKVGRVRRKGS